MNIADNIIAVRERIARAAVSASRDPSEIRLIAVSKTKPAEAIREAYAAGQRDFGENYAQELVQKAAELTDLHDLRWHFIGHLQSNKARLVVPVTHAVHTVHNANIVHELAKRAAQQGRGESREALHVLVEVNVGGEDQKHGAKPSELAAILDAARLHPSLDVRGLMTVPPADPEATMRAFEALRDLQHAHGGPARLPELSMGMSSDLEQAIACGATFVRIGSAIFGERR